MRRAAPFAVMGLLAGVIALLVLNLRERDHYVDAMTVPPPGPVNVEPTDGALDWLPLTTEHDGCVHTAEFTENHRWVRVRDHDGWYRLFWARDDVYYFVDPSTLNQSLNNPTARDPEGEWRIAFTYRPPAGCARKPQSVKMRYALAVTKGEGPRSEPPRRIRWFVGKGTAVVRTLDWILADSGVEE